MRIRRLCGTIQTMAPDPKSLDEIRAALEAAVDKDADEALPHLREAADRLTSLIDESMAEALLSGKVSLRSAGAAAVERAKYDHESGTPKPAPAPAAAPMRFKPRRPTK